MFLKQTNISYFKGIKHIGLLLVLVGLLAQTSVIAAEPKRIVVAGGDNFEPLLFLNADGEPDGIHADLWQLWSEKTGVEVELRLMDWAKTIPALRAGEVNAVDGVTYTPERAKFLELSAPYVEIPAYIYFHESIGGVRELNDLAGFPVGIIGGSHVENRLRMKAPKLRPVPYVNYEEIVRAATEGRLRVFVGEDPIIPFLFAKMGKRIAFRQTETSIFSSDMRVAVRKGDTELLALIEQGLAGIKPKERQQIYDKWSGVSLLSRIPWRWLIGSGAAIITFVTLVLLWNFQLRKQVGASTQTLKESEERYRLLIEDINDVIYRTDQNGILTYLSPVVQSVAGYEPTELIGRNFTSIVYKEDIELLANGFQELLSGVIKPLEYRIVNKSQKPIWVRSSSKLIYDEKTIVGIHGVLTDISEERKLKSQLDHAHKLEAIGTLAGGIAHDFNNILSPILLYTEMMLEDVPEGNTLKFNLKEVYNAVIRAKDLTRQILTFSRQTEPKKASIIISPIVKEALKLLRSSLPTTIEIRQNIKSDVSVVLADPTQIHQILMNLCTNAAYAMREKGGLLEVSLVDVDLTSQDTDHIPDLEPRKYVKLVVSDTGTGMESSVKERILEPYFTTKDKGEGTGLGLAVVHGIVKSYDGAITVDSEPGKGTVFQIFLPLIKGKISSKSTSATQLPKGNERVLLVDDEMSILKVQQQMLERLGYRVDISESGLAALEVFRGDPDGFDLIITDYTMPEMTGTDLTKAVMNIRDDIPVILSTGFSEHINEEKAKALGIRAFVMKPIVMNEMAETIRKVLDGDKYALKERL
jgi:PAS domain S-box-containing protein